MAIDVDLAEESGPSVIVSFAFQRNAEIEFSIKPQLNQSGPINTERTEERAQRTRREVLTWGLCVLVHCVPISIMTNLCIEPGMLCHLMAFTALCEASPAGEMKIGTGLAL